MVVPCRSVARNASSSPYAYCEIRPYPFATSGYDGAMQSRATGSSSGSAGPFQPSRRIARIARRRMRRSTYPRPSLDGVTPSPISIREVRTWSAMTRSRTSSGCDSLAAWPECAPYTLPVSSAARSRIGLTSSISYRLSTPCRIDAIRSSPMPVSMFLAGRSPRIGKSSFTPPGPRSCCMKTRFQYSRYRSSSTSGPPSEP